MSVEQRKFTLISTVIFLGNLDNGHCTAHFAHYTATFLLLGIIAMMLQ